MVPSLPMNEYNFYKIEQESLLIAQNPSLDKRDILKQCGETWTLITDEEKEKYVKMADKDKDRHDREIDQLHELGYFVNSEGIKSTD